MSIKTTMRVLSRARCGKYIREFTQPSSDSIWRGQRRRADMRSTCSKSTATATRTAKKQQV